MRNFSTVSSNVVLTYHINFDEYSGDSYYPNVRNYYSAKPLEVVLERLAIAFETPLVTVRNAFASIVSSGRDVYTGLCPSEENVIRDLYDFWKQNIVNQEASKSNCTMFNYTNLNTGAVVTWIYVVL